MNKLYTMGTKEQKNIHDARVYTRVRVLVGK